MLLEPRFNYAIRASPREGRTSPQEIERESLSGYGAQDMG